MDLSIIIVNYNSKAKLELCLSSIYKANLSNLNWELIVVDNHSRDNLNDLYSKYKNIKLISSSRNLGMGAGNNLGINKSQGKIILVLNPDTILSKDSIIILWKYLEENKEIGLLGPKLLSPDGSLQLSCSRFPSFFIPLFRRTFLGRFFKKKNDYFLMKDFDHNHIKEVDWLMGSFLMFRREIKFDSGKIFKPRFDERYFMYFEDIDLARQIKSIGKKVVYNPNTSVIHDHQRQSARHHWYLAIFYDVLVWHHISSWFKYFMKWGFKLK